MDIVVTTPKKDKQSAALEAEQVKENRGGSYFRKVPFLPHYLHIGDKVFYVEDGFVVGYALVDHIIVNQEFTCGTTGRKWGKGNYIVMDARTWHWIKPIPMRGFQGWHYTKFEQPIEVVGDWLDPRPL